MLWSILRYRIYRFFPLFIERMGSEVKNNFRSNGGVAGSRLFERRATALVIISPLTLIEKRGIG